MSSELNRAAALAATSEQGVTPETLRGAADLLRAPTVTALGIECERVESSRWAARWQGVTAAGLGVTVTRWIYPLGDDAWDVRVSLHRQEVEVDAGFDGSVRGRGPTLSAAAEACESMMTALAAALGGGA